MDGGLDKVSYLKGLRTQFPDIAPYGEDDWDWTWADEGYQFLETCDFGMAELTFQRLIVARPSDPDGFEGLAMVYKALGIRREAAVLIDEAVKLAEKAVHKDRMDPEALADIREMQRQIHEMPEVPDQPPEVDEDDDGDEDDEAGW